MTMPHLMNCAHSEDGWCLDCVFELGNDNMRMRSLLSERPALNTDLANNYAKWTGVVYASEQKNSEISH